VFGGLVKMNDPCPGCGHLFEREEGYFLGAMYVSYILGCGLVAAGFFTALALWPDVNAFVLCLWVFAAYLPLMPIIYRYSRVVWMHLDYLVYPGTTASAGYLAMRQKEINSPGPHPQKSEGASPDYSYPRKGEPQE
jgi:hypothetical protein